MAYAESFPMQIILPTDKRNPSFSLYLCEKARRDEETRQARLLKLQNPPACPVPDSAFGCSHTGSRSRRAQIAKSVGKEPATKASTTYGFKSAAALRQLIKPCEWHHVGIAPIIDDAHLMPTDCLGQFRLLCEDFPHSHNLVLIERAH